jgi:hypothetical protein
MSGTDADRLDLGVKALLEKAIELDKRGLQKEASHCYLKASMILIRLSNSSSLPSLQKHYLNRAEECVDRVRYISGIKTRQVDRPSVPSKPAIHPVERREPTSASRQSQETDDDNEDARERRLYLVIPADAKTGEYEIQVRASNYDATATAKKVISITGLAVANASATDVTSNDDGGIPTSIVVLTVILAIIFVVLLVVLIVLLTKKPAERIEDFGETSYY